MKNYVQHGDTLTMAAPSGGVVSGVPYLIGALFGVAAGSAAEGADFEFRVKGVFSGLPKATGATWAKGDPLYWDATAKKLTKSAGDNLQVATATEAAASGDTTGTARLNEGGAKLTGLSAPQANVADITLAAVTGVDGTGSNAASKADVDTRLTAVAADLAAIKAVLRAANLMAEPA